MWLTFCNNTYSLLAAKIQLLHVDTGGPGIVTLCSRSIQASALPLFPGLLLRGNLITLAEGPETQASRALFVNQASIGRAEYVSTLAAHVRHSG